ncbi:MerR family transcriptional regulator [Butyrivibrio sp. XPD2002]|uniref:MerR family transcriptional regulator n=1 Tax=Butyrivibrio sp. XPD2002 TaxID=1280665 RepID=UPI0004252F47|nr:MerR family transcriptional regulator [Butyrivibrio sp. XPD2002]
MKEMMTTGELARVAGVSQKALRIYDEKGLLRPVGYSEGNYKLYDKNSLMVLEKIIALKHVGFSLDEIKSHLENNEQESIEETLKNQLELMERRIYEMQKAHDCIKVALARLDEESDWDNVADVIKKMEMAQGQDERRWYAANHTVDGIEWYVKIFDSLRFTEGEKVLDLGCSYGLLWRENWDKIPENFLVDGVDIHESWADDFAKFLEEQKETLPAGTIINMIFKNLEDKETWDEIGKTRYDRIVAHYLLSYFEHPEIIVKKAAEVLAPHGFLSFTYFGTGIEHDYWERFFDENGFDKSFVSKRENDLINRENEFIKLISEDFSKVERVHLPGPIYYDDSEILFERLVKHYKDGNKYLLSIKDRLLQCFDRKIEEDGKIVVDTDSTFVHCYK